MKKSYKIIIIVLCCILVAGSLGYAIFSAVSGKDDTTEASTSTTESTSTATESSTEVTSGTSAQSTDPSTTVPTTVPTTTPPSGSNELLGKWTDSAGMSGYEFFADGTVTVTYVNVTVPILNLPVKGDFGGTYKVTDDKLQTSFSIYTASIDDEYTFVIDGNRLKLTNLEDGKTATYQRVASTAATTEKSTTTTTNTGSQGVVDPMTDDIVGTWVDSSGTVKYEFNVGGAFQVVYTNATVEALGDSPVSGRYTGIYIVDGSNLTVQYEATKKVTEKYTCVVSKNSLLLTGTDGSNRSFTREGTGITGGTTELSALLGKWMDATNVAGFEFLDGGYVKLTYVNFTIPVLQMPITGTFDGSYNVSNGTLNITYTVLGKTIRSSYIYVINGDTLTLTNKADGKVTSYIRAD